MPDPLPTLPKAPVLGYFNNISTATQVRIVAARLVFWIAILHFAGTTLFFLLTLWELWKSFDEWTRRLLHPGVPPVTPIGRLLSFLVMFTLAFAVSTLLAVFSRAIRHGRRTAVFLTFFYLAFLTSLFAIATISSVGIVIYSSIRGAQDAESIGLYLLPALAFLGALITLFLKELCSFLYWIARHPAAEM